MLPFLNTSWHTSINTFLNTSWYIRQYIPQYILACLNASHHTFLNSSFPFSIHPIHPPIYGMLQYFPPYILQYWHPASGGRRLGAPSAKRLSLISRSWPNFEVGGPSLRRLSETQSQWSQPDTSVSASSNLASLSESLLRPCWRSHLDAAATIAARLPAA